ncbi:MAG: S8 family serine peptidase [Planctomycetota bacterium]|nr:S8 family serine peptidase [Planctomycetota bacterium]
MRCIGRLGGCGVALMMLLAGVGSAPAQSATDVWPDRPALVGVHYGPFDPLVALPQIADELRAGPDTGLWLVQFRGKPTESARALVQSVGASLHTYMPEHAYVVRMDRAQSAAVRALPVVRWVGPYEPAYRLERELMQRYRAGQALPEGRYDLLMLDKHNDKAALAAAIERIGGRVVDPHPGSVLFTVELSGPQVLAALRLDEVLYLNRWSAPEFDMDNARIQGGANYVEVTAGYTGAGVRGHVYEGVEFNHPDFNTPFTAVNSANVASSHGHATAGIIFGNGTSHSDARGMAEDAVGLFTVNGTTGGLSRHQVLGNVVNNHEGMFTTASWGGSRTFFYNATSASTDDIIFDHRIPWTQSQSNAGNQDSRPEAWAKNIFSVGGVRHYNNSNPADDSWSGSGSTGPAADGRIKPDFCAYYDSIHTSDRTGSQGYSSGNSYTSFGGTSGATPICAGHNALAIQMYTGLIFGNSPRVSGGSVFDNRPYAQTLKALMIASAEQYAFNANSSDNLREHQGWGFPNLEKLYDNRDKTLIVPEDVVLTQGEAETYLVGVVAGQPELKACLTFVEPMGNPAANQQTINNLSLRVTAPDGTTYWGNEGLEDGNYSVAGGSENTIDSVECVFIEDPQVGQWRFEVIATSIFQDAHVATAATDATFALVVQGGTPQGGTGGEPGCAKYMPDPDPTSGVACNYVPFGQLPPSGLQTLFANNNGGAVGGAVYMDVTVTSALYLSELDVNTDIGSGSDLDLTVYRTAVGGSHVGNENLPGAWSAQSHGSGVAAAEDQPSRVTLDHPLLLAPGTYGLAIVARNFNHRYTNGTNVYADANLRLDFGSATNVPFTGTVFSPRTANLQWLYVPANGIYTNQRYQTVIRSWALGASGTITGLSFAPCGSGQHWNESLTIKMQHVPAGFALSNAFDANMPSPSVVMSVEDFVWPQTGGKWNEIGLQDEFVYNGADDLLIEVVAVGNVSTHYLPLRRESELRLWASAWTATLPATGLLDTGAAKMRVQFGCAGVTNLGRSCGGLSLYASADPVLGSVWGTSYAGAAANSLVFQRLGFNSSSTTYPFSLTGFGLPECYLFHDAVTTTAGLSDGSGDGGFAMILLPDPLFLGMRFYGQCLALNPAAPGGISVSEYLRIVIGLAQ